MLVIVRILNDFQVLIHHTQSLLPRNYKTNHKLKCAIVLLSAGAEPGFKHRGGPSLKDIL